MSVEFEKLRSEHLRLMEQNRAGAVTGATDAAATNLLHLLADAVSAADDEGERLRLQAYANHWTAFLARRTGLSPSRPGEPLRPPLSMAHAEADIPLPHLLRAGEFFENLKHVLIAGGNVALCGRPGLGKTSIAAQLARDPDLAAEFPDGVLWTRLGEQPDVLSSLSSWASQLGILNHLTRFPGAAERKQALSAAIGSSRFLIIIDDAWDAEAALALKVGGPNCVHVLTTYLFPVAVEFDAEGTTLVAPLGLEAAQQFLADLAPAEVARDPELASDLATLVDGIPLALTLIAKCLRSNGRPRYQSLLARLQNELRSREVTGWRTLLTPDRFPGSSGLRADTPAPLLSAIACSVGRLTRSERRTLYALSAFEPKANSFSEGASLAASAARSGTLHRLVERGLLESTPTGRFMLHRSVHEYLRGTLLELESTPRWPELVEYYVGYMEECRERGEAFDEDERNILTVFANVHPLVQTGDPGEPESRTLCDLLLRGVRVLFQYLDQRGLYAEAIQHLGYAYEAAERLGSKIDQATVLVQIGEISEKLGRYEEATRHLHAGRKMATEAGLPELACRALQGLGVVALNEGNYAAAEAHLLQALELTIDPEREGAIKTRLGWVEANRGNDRAARRYIREAMQLARANDDEAQLGMLYLDRGVIAFYRGWYDHARELEHRALEIAERLRDRKLECAAHQALIGVETARAEWEAAEGHAREALRLPRSIGHRWYEGIVWKELGEFCLAQSSQDRAARAFLASVRVAGEMKSPDVLAFGMYGLARVAARNKNMAEARRQGYSSLQVFRELKHRKTGEVEAWLTSLATRAGMSPVPVREEVVEASA